MADEPALSEQAEPGRGLTPESVSFAVFFLFVLLADTMVFWPPCPWLPAVLIALTATTGVALALRDAPAALRLLFRPPILFFTLFVLLGLVLSPLSINRFRAIYYAGGYGGLLLFAVTLARRSGIKRLLDLTRVALCLGIVASFAAHVCGLHNGFTMHNGEVTTRFSGWYMNPNPMAMVCALFLLLTLADRREPSVPGTRWHLFVNLPVVFLAAMILLSAQSRTVWFALTGALGTFFLVCATRPGGVPFLKRLPWWSWAVLILVLVCTLATAHQRLRLESSFLSMNSRSLCWDFAVEKIEERPWLGYGLGSVYDLLADYPDPMMRCGVHNAYIEAALYSGVAGGILFLLFMAGLAARAIMLCWRDERNSALLLLSVFYLILALPSPIVLGRPMSATLVVLLLAAIMSRPEASGHKTEERCPR